MDFPEVLIPLFGIFMGSLVVLIPIVGLTVRFAIKPLLDSWARTRQSPLVADHMKVLEKRISFLEQQVEGLEKQNERLLEEAEFRAQLKG